MKIFPIFFVFLLPLVSSAPNSEEVRGLMDHFKNLQKFIEKFNQEPPTDEETIEQEEEALEEAQEEIEEVNEKYVNGEISWFDALNPWSDLPKEEFEKQKTGNLEPPEEEKYSRGNLEPTGADRIDEASERYFADFRQSMKLNRAKVPGKYDSVKLGHVSPVKNQKKCGSCVAFSNMAAIETCFKRVSGVFGDYSEQQLIDCGFGENGAKGCDGAWTHSYIKWAADSGKELIAEGSYPYKNDKPSLTCPTDIEGYNKGAKVSGAWHTYQGDEKTLKGLVAKHGAVVTSVSAYGPFSDYKGGVFSGCDNSDTDHAVTVVGYGKDKASGKKYWLIKNSWGTNWGEEGFIRLERDVGMCGVGKTLAVVECEAVAGPTDPTITTETPCDDRFSNCPELAKTSCWQSGIKESCQKSCGLCKGLTPHESNTCYDTYGNCPTLAQDYCYKETTGSKCQKSCGLCEGMTPAKSYTCYNKFSNCADLCGNENYAKNDCKAACGNC